MNTDVEILYQADLSGELLLSASGQWLHNGTEIKHKRLNLALHRSIVWDKKHNKYLLQIGKGQAEFDIADTAYFVKKLIVDKNSCKIELLDQSLEDLDFESLYTKDNNASYCLVKGAHPAKFLSTAHQVLMQYALDENHLLILDKKIKLNKR